MSIQFRIFTPETRVRSQLEAVERAWIELSDNPNAKNAEKRLQDLEARHADLSTQLDALPTEEAPAELTPKEQILAIVQHERDKLQAVNELIEAGDVTAEEVAIVFGVKQPEKVELDQAEIEAAKADGGQDQ